MVEIRRVYRRTTSLLVLVLQAQRECHTSRTSGKFRIEIMYIAEHRAKNTTKMHILIYNYI